MLAITLVDLAKCRPHVQKEDSMGMMIIRHKVRDYGQWRPIFDGHADMQKAAGLSNPRVYHSADSNKSEIVVVFDTKDTKCQGLRCFGRSQGGDDRGWGRGRANNLFS
jgi:hypothetical protein